MITQDSNTAVSCFDMFNINLNTLIDIEKNDKVDAAVKCLKTFNIFLPTANK